MAFKLNAILQFSQKGVSRTLSSTRKGFNRFTGGVNRANVALGRMRNAAGAATLATGPLTVGLLLGVKEAANFIAMMTYRNIRQPTMIPSIVGTLVGGFNEDGTTELFSVEPAGTVVKVEDYDANFGSGMPFVLGFLEREYNEDIDIEKGVELVLEAIKSSTQRDIGSGYGIDIWAIKKEGIKHEIAQEITAEYRDKKGNKR